MITAKKIAIIIASFELSLATNKIQFLAPGSDLNFL